MDYLKFEKDIEKLKDHKGSTVLDIEKSDPELIKNIRMYRDSGLIDKNDVAYILDNGKFPTDSNSVYVKGSASLKKSWESPVETPKVEQPVERSAMETALGSVFPRTQKRMDEKTTGVGGAVVAVGLDALSFPARTLNTLQRWPTSLWNTYVGETPQDIQEQKNPLRTIAESVGDITGKGFETPNLPSWTPDWIKKVGSIANPVIEGIGEFGTSIARGPILPGQVGKPIVGGILGKMSPGTLKTALEVGGNMGFGAGLGTSESVARGEGLDPFGAILGGTLGGGLTIAPKYATYLSDKKTGNILLDAQNEKINGALADLNFKIRRLEDLKGKNTSTENIKKAENDVEISKKNYEKVYNQAPEKWTGKFNESGKEIKEPVSRQYWEANPSTLSQNYKHSLDNLATSRGFVGERPSSLMDALEIYAPKRNPIIPMQEIEPVVDNLSEARRLSRQAETETGARAAAGKLGALFQLRDLLKGESYLPETVLRQLPDATTTTPSLIRGGNSLQDYLKSLVMQQDSTKRQ